jgi:hypothetical protein
MMWKKLALSLAFLLVLIVATFGYFFVQGTSTQNDGNRRTIVLTSAERDLVLTEMRHMLKAVNGIVDALAVGDMPRAAQAASSAGMGMAADVNPLLLLKVPLDFKQLGLGTHTQFDQLAAAINQGGMTQTAALQRLSAITSRCVACHETNRLGIGQ